MPRLGFFCSSPHFFWLPLEAPLQSRDCTRKLQLAYALAKASCFARSFSRRAVQGSASGQCAPPTLKRAPISFCCVGSRAEQDGKGEEVGKEAEKEKEGSTMARRRQSRAPRTFLEDGEGKSEKEKPRLAGNLLACFDSRRVPLTVRRAIGGWSSF